MIPQEVADIIAILESWYGSPEDEFEYHNIAWEICNKLKLCKCD